MTQPCGYHCREVEREKKGFYTLPEYPLALEPRALTRVDAYAYARAAFDAGVRYVGGCCGFEPHHVRALAMELEAETGRKPPGRRHADKWAESLQLIYRSTEGRDRDGDRVTEEYWKELIPAAGRTNVARLAEKLCRWEYK